VYYGEPVRRFGAAHFHRIAKETDALTPQTRRPIADDHPLGELGRRLDVAAPRRGRELIDRLVVTPVRIERLSPGYFR
jgi:hypothetical protein